MYIQLTTRCNMRCAHCCFSCTSEGDDMSESVFRKAVELARQNDSHIMLGGGEPTVHPRFWEFIGILMSYTSEWWPESPHAIVTNGKLKQTALALAGMAKSGLLFAELSQDAWHEEISSDVVDAFTRGQRRDECRFDYARDLRGTRTVSNLVSIGRAAENQLAQRKGCGCGDQFITPLGDVYMCACKSTHLGNVLTGAVDLSDWYERYDASDCARS